MKDKEKKISGVIHFGYDDYVCSFTVIKKNLSANLS